MILIFAEIVSRFLQILFLMNNHPKPAEHIHPSQKKNMILKNLAVNDNYC